MNHGRLPEDYHHRAGKRSGKPCIRGLRINVYDIFGNLAAGITHAEIIHDFPYLTQEDILASLAYVADREGRADAVAK